MAPGALQLFPPPDKPQTAPPMWPARASSRRGRAEVEFPDQDVERMEGAKSQADFHELVIRVNSDPGSPIELQQIHIPKKAHIPHGKAPLEATGSFYQAPARVDSAVRLQNDSPVRSSSAAGKRVASPPLGLGLSSAVVQDKRGPSPVPTRSLASNNPYRTPTPDEGPSRRVVSPLPEDHNGIIGLAISPDHPSNTGHRRVVSPVQSDIASSRSGSPTLVRSNSAVTTKSKKTTLRVNTEQPVMRSIFPRYNPDLPLAQQSYQPMITTPPSRIPREKINRPINSPKYLPHGNIESLEDDGPAPRASTAIPYYTPPTALDSLWNAANGQGNPLVQMYTLQIHRKASTTVSGESQIILGPSESQPFYTLSHSELPPPNILDDDEPENAADHELLITRHNPIKPGSFPVAHFTLSPTPASSMGSPLPSSSVMTEEPVVLISTIYPKMAAVAALESAAQSPAASHIAQFDPNATSPAAERLAQDVLLGTAERECCALVWTRSGYGQPSQFSSSSPGTYALHHPSLGAFTITHEGDMTPGLSPILGSAPLQSPRRRGSKPARISILNPYATPPEQRRPDTPNDDAVLARLDFGTDSLVLNVAAILKLDNPYLIDVIVSTLLSVALAEEKRIRREIQFEAPPLQAVPPVRSNTEPSLKKKKSFWQRVGKRAEKKVRQKIKYDAPMDLEAWGAPPKEASKDKNGKNQDEELPFLTTAILGVLTFTFKTAVWVLGITIKIVGGVIVKVSHWVVTKA